jgi:outer membrane autotransporter protein
MRILTISQQVERTITGGTTFFDLPLTALPTGAIHAAAPQAGFGASGRFLRRLTDGPGDGALRRGAFWGEAFARDGSFDASAALGRVEGQGEGLVLGLLLSPAEHLTFGIAGEYGSGALAIPDPLTREGADLRQLLIGVHGRAVFGKVELSVAASYGGMRVRSSGASELGTARAAYDADLFGLSGEAGYRLGFGRLTLRPHLGAARLHWDREGLSENGGPAPLSIAADDLRQTRLWAGADAALALDGEGSRLTLTAYGRAVRATGDRQSVATTFDPQLPGMGFDVAGPVTARTSAELGAGLSWRVAERVSLALGYDGWFADNQRDHAARGAVRAVF